MSETDSALIDLLLTASPFQQQFDLSTVAGDADEIVIRLGFGRAVERGEGTGQFHGGAIAALIDIAGDIALAVKVGRGLPTINFRVDFLSAAVGSALFAHATARRIGRTVGVADVEVKNDAGKLVAIGRGCYSTGAG